MQSVLAQSLSDFELLVVNDGSQDNSVKICRSLADRRTRILHQRNFGVSSARNTGIANARAGIIALLDSDDISAPEDWIVMLRTCAGAATLASATPVQS